MITPHWLETLKSKFSTDGHVNKPGPSPTLTPANIPTPETASVSEQTNDQPHVTVTVHTLEGAPPVNPATIAFTAEELAALLEAGTQFIALLQKIRANQADAWTAVAQDFGQAHDAFTAAVSSYHNDANALPVGTAQAAPMGPPESVPSLSNEHPGTVAGAQG